MVLQGIVDVGPVAIRLTDLLRLFTLPVFAWVMWRDVQTRRIASIVWTPLTILALALLVVDLQRITALGAYRANLLLFSAAIGIGLVISLAILFNYVGGFGGADARAFMTIAVLFPFYPEIVVFGTEYPILESTLPVFSFTILVNTVLWGIFYPVLLVLGNAIQGQFDRRMLLGVEKSPSEIPTAHGKLLHNRGHTSILDRLHTLVVPRRRGLDLDALRMYLRWRGTTLAEVRANPGYYRDPGTVPDEPNEPTDGAVAATGAEGGHDSAGPGRGDEPTNVDGGRPADADDEHFADPWGADAFFDDIDGTAYGTSPETLRHGLDVVSRRDGIWVSPGIPFLVPVFIGLVVSFLFGDTLVFVMRFTGLL